MPSYDFCCEGCGKCETLFFSMADVPSAIACSCGGALTQKISGGVGTVFKGDSFTCNEYGRGDMRDRFEVGRKVKKARELKESGQVPVDEVIHVDDRRIK